MSGCARSRSSVLPTVTSSLPALTSSAPKLLPTSACAGTVAPQRGYSSRGTPGTDELIGWQFKSRDSAWTEPGTRKSHTLLATADACSEGG
jgi:hypothetical protein